MSSQYIRVITICVIRKGNTILVFEGYDPTRDQTFYRPLGGQIEFGEYSLDALRREFREEINAELVNLRYVQTLENIFTAYGKPSHEVIFVFEGELANQSLYNRNIIIGQEDNGESFEAKWVPIADFHAEKFPLYPNGLLELLEKE
ncbi:MAG: NUDIX domain-containing protein [Anaerolineae bacterium]|nr:NUDIX domain-containing protein [Anaerolineae bacterium]